MSSSYVEYSSADNGRNVLYAATDEANLFRAAISISSVIDDVTGLCLVMVDVTGLCLVMVDVIGLCLTFSGMPSTEEPGLLSRTGNSEKPTEETQSINTHLQENNQENSEHG